MSRLQDPLSAIDAKGGLTVWQAADVLIQHYRTHAQAAAARFAEARRKKGDALGHRVWLTILTAIRELQRTERAPSERLH